MSVTRRALLAIGAVTLLAGALRFHALSRPDEKVFDETYYATDACWYADDLPYEECGLENDVERSWVHPPLGKQMIAWGLDLFGYRPFGWRFMAAVAGTATVALAGILAYLLFGSAVWAGIAALLVASEHLLFVQSRVAMLDVFLAFFVVLGFVFLAADRRQDPPVVAEASTASLDAADQPPPPPRRRFVRVLHLAAGAAFGAAMAVKWSGFLALVAGALLAIAWTIRRIMAGRTRETEFVGLGLAFVVVPFVVYVLPWIPWLQDRDFSASEFAGHHDEMLEYHRRLKTEENGEPIHPYMSGAWSWLFLLRPVAYYWKGEPSCCAEILGIGNPLVFWGAVFVIPYLAWRWIRGREWTAGAVLVPILLQLLPWFLVARPLFLFYMTPVTPFLALGMVLPLRDLMLSGLDRRAAAAVAAVVVTATAGLFLFFWPILSAAPITYEQWETRIWFDGWI